MVVAALVLWVTGARVWYHLADRPTLHRVTTRDGWSLSLWSRAPTQQRFAQPVVLCHGLGNNHAFFEFRGRAHLARVLADAGFRVFTVDFRGAGRSVAPDQSFADATIDDHIDIDAPAIADAVEQLTGERRLFWVGHSLGGVIGVLASARGLEGKLDGLVTIGSPLSFDRRPLFLRGLLAGRALAPSGRFPLRVLATLIAPLSTLTPPPSLAKVSALVENIDALEQRYLLANVFADLWKGVLVQLERWIATGELRSLRDGTDLRGAAFAVRDVPTLVIGGSHDQLAPVHVTRALFDGLQAADKELVLVGREFGQLVDYGHGDLVLGRHAPDEVYPAIVSFLERHARRVG
jgi:pimeloyl-ACP methyl ester carboxylesterase